MLFTKENSFRNILLCLYFTLSFGCLCVGQKVEKRFIQDVSSANTLCPEPEIHFYAMIGSRIGCVKLCAKYEDCNGVIFRQTDKQCFGIKKGSSCNVGTTSLPGAQFYKYEIPTPECDSSGPLMPGLPDNQITAFSSYNGYDPWEGRLDGLNYWASGYETLNEYIQVDFSTPRIITGVVTQGASVDDEWFNSYNLTTSLDCVTWDVTGPHPGNFDRTTHVTLTLATAVLARCVRVHPLTWYIWPSGRIEVLGCIP